MSGRMRLFIILLILNLLVVVVYLIWNHLRRKELKYMDESRNDAVMSGCRTDLCVCSILDQPAFYADVHGSF